MENPEGAGGTRKTYVQPSLVAYGSIAKLTQEGEGSGGDGSGMPGMTKQCL